MPLADAGAGAADPAEVVENSDHAENSVALQKSHP